MKKPILIGVISAIGMFAMFGIVTAIIPNSFFARMTPVGWTEWLSLAITSALLGTFVGLNYASRQQSRTCNTGASIGGIFGFLTFGCSLCNKVLLAIFGASGIVAFFEPLRPILGFLSIVLLCGAIYIKLKEFKGITGSQQL